jgi:hypothetical protein
MASLQDNIVFCPYDKFFNETAFRISCDQSTIISDALTPTLKNGIEGLVTVARGCYEQGF